MIYKKKKFFIGCKVSSEHMHTNQGFLEPPVGQVSVSVLNRSSRIQKHMTYEYDIFNTEKKKRDNSGHSECITA